MRLSARSIFLSSSSRSFHLRFTEVRNAGLLWRPRVVQRLHSTLQMSGEGRFEGETGTKREHTHVQKLNALNKQRAIPLIRTLRVDHLTHADYRDWSLDPRPSIRIIHNGTVIMFQGPQFIREGRFPPQTRGFLYYFRPPFAPGWAGQLRFRLVPSGDPAHFYSSDACDLLGPNGALSFCVTLLRMACSPTWAPVIALLEREGLVTAADVAALRSRSGNTFKHRQGDVLLYAFTQPLVLDFGQCKNAFSVVTSDEDGQLEMKHLTFSTPALAHRHTCGALPYSGSAVCCFERAEESNMVYLRILKIIKPMKYADLDSARAYPLPQEGELLHIKRGIWQSQLRDNQSKQSLLGQLKMYPGVTYDMF